MILPTIKETRYKLRIRAEKAELEAERWKKLHDINCSNLASIGYKNSKIAETVITYLITEATELTSERDNLKEKVDYCTSMGLTFGIMKTSNCPEGFLQHNWSESSDFQRMSREWMNSIGWERKVTKAFKRGMVKAAEIVKGGCFLHEEAPDSKFAKTASEAIIQAIEEQKMTMKITELISGIPELCPRCKGRGEIPEDMYDNMTCPTCKGDRTVVRAKVSGEMIVRVTAKVGDAV